jgi:hypothetical protein
MVWHFDGRGVCLFLPGGEWNTEGIVFFFLGGSSSSGHVRVAIPHDEKEEER